MRKSQNTRKIQKPTLRRTNHRRTRNKLLKTRKSRNNGGNFFPQPIQTSSFQKPASYNISQRRPSVTSTTSTTSYGSQTSQSSFMPISSQPNLKYTATCNSLNKSNYPIKNSQNYCAASRIKPAPNLVNLVANNAYGNVEKRCEYLEFLTNDCIDEDVTNKYTHSPGAKNKFCTACKLLRSLLYNHANSKDRCGREGLLLSKLNQAKICNK